MPASRILPLARTSRLDIVWYAAGRGPIVTRFVRDRQHGCLAQLGGADRLPAQPVGGAVAGGGGQPRSGPAGNPVARPALERLREGVLSTLLNQIPITNHPN